MRHDLFVFVFGFGCGGLFGCLISIIYLYPLPPPPPPPPPQWTAPSLDGPDDGTIRAGYVIRYATGTRTGNFTFATVAGAGHMAPTFKPPQALALLKRFLANEAL